LIASDLTLFLYVLLTVSLLTVTRLGALEMTTTTLAATKVNLAEKNQEFAAALAENKATLAAKSQEFANSLAESKATLAEMVSLLYQHSYTTSSTYSINPTHPSNLTNDQRLTSATY
jgi:hypothetical protein